MKISEQAESIITAKLPKYEKAIKLIRMVSAIPYQRIGSLNPEDMLGKGRGSCTPKHVFLAKCLDRIDVPVKFLIMPFFYKKLEVNYPASHKRLIGDLPISYHIALKAKLEKDWIIIDTTWDTGLKGFPTNAIWDGHSDMKLAVNPEEIIEKEEDPRSFEKEMSERYTEKEKQIRRDFYVFFDDFLNSARK